MNNVLNLNIPTMLTIKETADRIGIAEHYIRSLAIKNEIVHVRCGKKYLINLEKFIEYLNTSKGEMTNASTQTSNKYGINAIKT